MQIGDKVWIFDSNHRQYTDDKGNKTHSPWYRGHFVERFIVGETKQSWLIGYEGSNPESRTNIKANKKTLTYKGEYGADGIIYTSEENINQRCWIHDNQFTISERVRRCNEYDKLIRIQEILDGI